MRVRVSDQALVEDLIQFLRRCECRVSQVGSGVIEVEPRQTLTYEAAMNLVRAGRCYGCGGAVAESLRDLGSALCHDCRGGGSRVNGHEHDDRASRVEVEGYLRVWGTIHGETRSEVLE